MTEKDVTINGKTTSQFLASVILDNLPPRPLTSGWSGRRRTAPRTSCRIRRSGRHTPKLSM
ncbi:hypothetical protein [Escherichia coli]|uniref:hypothetical protein n=1 Tax=Escherichia coli TaxID=562 RepID=UPI003EB6C973